MRSSTSKPAIMNPYRIVLLVLCSFFILPSASRAGLFLDPIGDTFGNLGDQIDIQSITTESSGSGVRFQITFVDAVAQASSGAANSLVGYLDFDTDVNEGTGSSSYQDLFGQQPTLSLGSDYFVDMSSDLVHPGRFDVFASVSLDLMGTVSANFSGNHLEFDVPLTLLGNDDGTFAFGLIVGNLTEATDEAPNGTAALLHVASVPESGNSLVLTSGLLALLGMHQWMARGNCHRREVGCGPKVDVKL